MAMAALPMIGQALAGLAGAGKGGANGNGGNTNGNRGAASASDTGNAGLTPEAQRAVKVLQLLAAAYGDGATSDPRITQLRKQLGVGEFGSGKTADAIQAERLWKDNAANAFNTLDNQLVSYITRIAGSNKIDRDAMYRLIREVNVALAELGTQAYTQAGQRRVHQILTDALQKAHSIVVATHANAADTATAINQLSSRYLQNLAGQQAKPVATGATQAGQQAISTALAQIGKPYVWGAEGPNSFDCSGLMQYSARAAGVQIPRTAALQYQKLPKVAPGDIRPGDLIFPASRFNGGAPKHVVMYIGNGQCIEAPQAGQTVRTLPLPASYHATRWT
ncbi:C40 family peptidase [Nocardia brasiliensis]|uniref:C40 family peptidase n=1 Tax=Nocardia brasiliensis TaxID=37326 RepID=UPI0024583E47|nr:NlpC/P60 family protein [Nocardia brasiliensis]